MHKREPQSHSSLAELSISSQSCHVGNREIQARQGTLSSSGGFGAEKVLFSSLTL